MKRVEGTIVRRLSRGTVERRGGWWRNRFRAEVLDPITGEVRVHELNRVIARVSDSPSRAHASRLLDAALAREGFEAVAPGARIGALAYSEKFLAEIVAGYRPNSVRHYRSILRRDLQPAMGKLWLDELGAGWLRRIMAAKAERYAQATVAMVRKVALQMLRQAGRDGYSVRPINPADVKLPKARTVLVERPFVDDSQFRKLLEGTDYPLKAMIALGGWAGLRGGEILGTRWQDVDLVEELLTVRYQAQDGRLVPCKTSTSSTALPMLSPLVATLREYRLVWAPNPNDLLFATRAGTPMETGDVRRRLWHPALKALGLPPMGLHALRHGLPRRLLAMRLTAQSVAALMRHRDLRMTTRYWHFNETALGREMHAAGLRSKPPEQQP